MSEIPKINPVKAASPSKWFTFDDCPLHMVLNQTRKVKDESAALDHGRLAHDEIALYIEGAKSSGQVHRDVRPYFKNVRTGTAILMAREAFKRKDLEVGVEVKAAFDRKLKYLDDYFDDAAWMRGALDLAYPDPENPEDVFCIDDWKTGQKRPNDVEQLRCYAWMVSLLAPGYKRYRARDLYLKDDTIHEETWTAAQIKGFGATWQKRFVRITNPRTKFPATPSREACRFCPHGTSRGGPCTQEYQAPGARSRGAINAWSTRK